MLFLFDFDAFDVAEKMDTQTRTERRQSSTVFDWDALDIVEDGLQQWSSGSACGGGPRSMWIPSMMKLT